MSASNFLLDRRTENGERITLDPFKVGPLATLKIRGGGGRAIINADFAAILQAALGEFVERSRPTEVSDLSADPVRIEVVRWKCPFCAKSNSRRPGIRPHIETCYHNPASQACGTCYRHDPGTEEDGWEESCVVGAPMWEIVEDKWNPGEKREVRVRNCPQWLAKPAERRPE